MEICPLYTANSAFGKLIQFLKEVVDLDQMAIDFQFFFKCMLVDRRTIKNY